MKKLSLFNNEPTTDIWHRFHQDMNQLIRSMDSYFPLSIDEESNLLGSDWIPSVNIKEEDKQFVIKADIPGVDPKDIEVSMDNGMLSIKGERKEEKSKDTNGYFRHECVQGVFYRRFSMPDSADPEKITAKGKDGVLTVTIGKRKGSASKPKVIKVDG